MIFIYTANQEGFHREVRVGTLFGSACFSQRCSSGAASPAPRHTGRNKRRDQCSVNGKLHASLQRQAIGDHLNAALIPGPSCVPGRGFSLWVWRGRHPPWFVAILIIHGPVVLLHIVDEWHSVRSPAQARVTCCIGPSFALLETLQDSVTVPLT